MDREKILKLAEGNGWSWISCNQKLSEEFIREFQDKVDWFDISRYQKLSEEFIREFQDKVDWFDISCNQKLSEEFIREFQDKVDWPGISCNQKLSEEFIREFQDKVNWPGISCYQKLSEKFIGEFKDKVNWYWISCNQNLSKSFAEEFKLKTALQIINLHETIDSRESAKAYAKKHNLKIDDIYLYAFRDHDDFGRGTFNKTIFYEVGKYYRDWHCDPRKEKNMSYGYGIWPKGNTKVRVKLNDFCVAVENDAKGKARVWGFEVME